MHDEAYYEQLHARQRDDAAVAAVEANRAALAVTPGSVLSEELEPLPIVTELLDRIEHRLPADDEEDDETVHTQLVSEAAAPTSEQTQEASPSALPRRKLRRAGQESPKQAEGGVQFSFSDSSDSEGEAGRSPIVASKEKRVKSAFDVLEEGALNVHFGLKQPKKKEKRAANEYVAEQADESEEEEGRFGSLFKSAPEAGEDENAPEDEDLDGTLAELVDDAKVDAEIQEEQDKLAQDRFMQDQAADDAKQLKMAQKVAAGEAKKRKRGQGDLSDSDYEDDEGMYRKAKERKPVKFNDRVEAIGWSHQSLANEVSLSVSCSVQFQLCGIWHVDEGHWSWQSRGQHRVSRRWPRHGRSAYFGDGRRTGV